MLGYGGRIGGRGHATPRETKKETPGTPHGAYGSLSLPAGDLNEGRSFLNEFRHIPHEVLFCAAAYQFTTATPPPPSPPPLASPSPFLAPNLFLLEIIVGQIFEFQCVLE